MMHLDVGNALGVVGGGGVLFLAVARHMPAPLPESVYYRWFFDTVQDLAKNNDRIGEVRPAPVSTEGHAQ
jgi:hypothetical protein